MLGSNNGHDDNDSELLLKKTNAALDEKQPLEFT